MEQAAPELHISAAFCNGSSAQAWSFYVEQFAAYQHLNPQTGRLETGHLSVRATTAFYDWI